MQTLAIHGGKPVREQYLSYGKQYIDDADVAAVAQVMRSDFLTCGEQVELAERELCALTGAKYAAVVSNGTTALHCACLAAGISRGDEVITTPITFAASANCVLYCGGTPIFADIDPETWQISPQSIRQKITPRTKAVIAVDYTGQPCDYASIREICEEHNLVLIEDAAHAIGTAYQGKKSGNIADLTTFSFHPVKTVTSGEGGAVLTNSAELYRKLKLVAAHGITRDPDTIGVGQDWYYEQIELGNNYRITDMQCALLRSQLKKLPQFAERRANITQLYNEAFAQMPQLILQREYLGSETVRHLYVIRLRAELLSAGRKQVFDALRAENIGVNVHYIPVYYFPYYARMGYRRGACPQAEALYEEILTLPLFYAMTDEDARDVVRAVQKVVSYYSLP